MKRFNIYGIANKASAISKLVSVSLLALTSLVFTTGVSALEGELIVNGDFEEPNLAVFPAKSRGFTDGWTTFYGLNKPDADSCTSHLRGPVNPLLPFDPFSNPLEPATFGPDGNWEVECNGDVKIGGWSVWWVFAPGDGAARVLALEQDPATGVYTFNPGTDPIGRIEIQSNKLVALANPLLPPDKQLENAKFGEQKAELDSHDRIDVFTGKPVADSNVALTQTVDTCPNQKYVLTYHWKSRLASNSIEENGLTVQVGGMRVRQHGVNAAWFEETVNFVSGNDPTQIAFISDGVGTTFGMSLDGVSVIGPVRDLLGECPTPSCVAGTSDGSSKDGKSKDKDDGGLDLCEPETPSDCLCPPKGDKADKPNSLELLYDGDDFTSHNQGSDKSSVDTFGVLPTDANIKVIDEKKGTVLFSGLVSISDTFVIERVNEPRVEIYDGTTLVQVVRFHASCSQPLEVMDTFGGITIWAGIQ